METEPVIKAVSLFLLQIDSRHKEKFLDLARIADETLFQFLTAPLSSNKFEIPAGDAELKEWTYINPSARKLIDLTHQLVSDGTGISYESFLEKSPAEQNSDSVNNVFSEQREYFLFRLGEVNGVNFLRILNNSTTFDDYRKKVLLEINIISGQMCLADYSLKDDVSLMFCALRMMVDNMDNPNYEQSEVICYGASMFICALTEKLLRLFYQYIEKMNRDVLTLSKLLNENNSIGGVSFSKKHKVGLKYFLLKIFGRKAGRNFRNILAHWDTEMSPGFMTPFFTSRLLWLFTDVLNSVYLYFEPQNSTKTDLSGDHYT